MAMKLGEALVKDSLITRDQLKLALERQVIFGGRLGTNIVELGILKERDLAAFLSRFFKVPAVDASQLSSIDEDTISCISKEHAEKYKVVPFRKDRNRLHVAMLEPKSMDAIDELRFISGFDIIPYVVTELRLMFALEKYYGTERDLRYISTFAKEEEPKDADQAKKELLKTKEEFSAARNKEEIIGLLLNETKKIATRSAVFILKGQTLSGWKGRGLSVENVEIPLPHHSVFADVIKKKSYYRGPLLRIAENEPLIKLLSGTPQDCLVVPLQIREKTIGVLYADNGNQAVLDASLSYINTVVSMAGLGFEIVILRNKIMDL